MLYRPINYGDVFYFEILQSIDIYFFRRFDDDIWSSEDKGMNPVFYKLPVKSEIGFPMCGIFWNNSDDWFGKVFGNQEFLRCSESEFLFSVHYDDISWSDQATIHAKYTERIRFVYWNIWIEKSNIFCWSYWFPVLNTPVLLSVVISFWNFAREVDLHKDKIKKWYFVICFLSLVNHFLFWISN